MWSLGAAVVDASPARRAVVADDWAERRERVGLRAVSAADGADVVLHLVDTPDVGADVVARVPGPLGGDRAGAGHLRGQAGTPRGDRVPVLGELLGTLSGDEGPGRSPGATTWCGWSVGTLRPG